MGVFTCIYIYAPVVGLVYWGARRGHQSSLELELQTVGEGALTLF